MPGVYNIGAAVGRELTAGKLPEATQPVCLCVLRWNTESSQHDAHQGEPGGSAGTARTVGNGAACASPPGGRHRGRRKDISGPARRRNRVLSCRPLRTATACTTPSGRVQVVTKHLSGVSLRQTHQQCGQDSFLGTPGQNTTDSCATHLQMGFGGGGGARHVAVAAAVYRVTIIIQDHIDYRIGSGEEEWFLRYGRGREHDDAVVPQDNRDKNEKQQRSAHTDSSTNTPASTSAAPMTQSTGATDGSEGKRTGECTEKKTSMVDRTGTDCGH